MQNVLIGHVSDRSSHLTGKRSVYTALCYDVIRDVFVLFTFASAEVEVIWFDTLGSD